MLSALQKNIDRDFNENINLNHLIKKNNNNTIENVDTRSTTTTNIILNNKHHRNNASINARKGWLKPT